jgi:hypothetical protein
MNGFFIFIYFFKNRITCGDDDGGDDGGDGDIGS